MRNRELTKKLKDVLNEVMYIENLLERTFNTEGYEAVGRKQQIINAIYNIRTELKDIGLMGNFERELMDLLQSPTMVVEKNEVVSPDSILSIKEKLSVSINSIQLTLPNESEYGFIYGIKLPEYKAFDEVDEFTKKLNYIFSTILSDKKSVKLVGFDTGSEWIRIALEGFADYKLITLFVAEALKLAKLSIEKKKQLEESNEDYLTADRELLIENIRMNQDLMRDMAIKRILNKNGHAEDAEEFGRCQKAFEDMMKLLREGTRFELEKESPSESDEKNQSGRQSLPKIEELQGSLDSVISSLIEYQETSDEEELNKED